MLAGVNVGSRYEPVPLADPRAEAAAAGAEAPAAGVAPDDAGAADAPRLVAPPTLGVPPMLAAPTRRSSGCRRATLYGIATKVISQHLRGEGRRVRALAAIRPPAPAELSVEEISDRITAAQLRPRLHRVPSACCPTASGPGRRLPAWAAIRAPGKVLARRAI